MKKATRAISQIAKEIKLTWAKPYYGAVPYISAMLELQTIKDNYYQDSARSIINYFLANASTWRGSDAKRLKAELKEVLTHE